MDQKKAGYRRVVRTLRKEHEANQKLPKRCTCGGKLVYTFAHGLTFSHCDRCTPVVEVRVPRSAQ